LFGFVTFLFPLLTSVILIASFFPYLEASPSKSGEASPFRISLFSFWNGESIALKFVDHILWAI
jgi:hypothetical protein